MERLSWEQNPVTRYVLMKIIGGRIDRAAAWNKRHDAGEG